MAGAESDKLAVVSTANQDSPLMGEAILALPASRFWAWMCGNMLTTEIPEPPSGLHQRVLERGELGEAAARFAAKK